MSGASVMNLDQPRSPGFYGKLPTLGDFVSRRLPQDFLQPWDRWLQSSLAESRAQLGDAWLNIYLTSPLWRFVLTSGVAGQGAWTGVLMPSVDRVGRYFPLTLACPLEPGMETARLLGEAGWFERAESLLLDVLDASCGLAEFDAQVLDLGSPSPAPMGFPISGPTHEMRANAWRLAASSPAVLASVCPTLLALALEQVFCAYSLWWSSGSERVEPSYLVCQGLPPTDGFSALIGGDWSQGRWWDLGAVTWPGAGR